jgi:hypothetical protein
MDTVTYPDTQVADLLSRHFVPVQVDIQKAAKLADRYLALWTPSLNVIGSREKRIYHAVGWLPPDEFAAMLQTARGHFYMQGKKFDRAAPLFKDVFETAPRSSFAPEALYYRGVCRYLATHDVEELKQDWIMLQRFYPQDAWAMKSNIL